MASTDIPQRPSQFERHLQTGLSSVAVAGVLGIGAIVWGIPAQNATVNVKLEQMQLDIADLKKGVGDRYTRTDADRDRGQYERRFRALEQRMNILEQALMRRSRADLPEKKSEL